MGTVPAQEGGCSSLYDVIQPGTAVNATFSCRRSRAPKKKMAANDTGEDDDDVGALIYRESQLRKTEAAAEFLLV